MSLKRVSLQHWSTDGVFEARSTGRGRGMCCWGHRGQQQLLGKPRRRSILQAWCGRGGRWGQRKINRCKAAPRGKAQTGRADTAGVAFLSPHSLSRSIIFYLLWASPCAMESTSWNKAKAEESWNYCPAGSEYSGTIYFWVCIWISCKELCG